MHPNYLQIKSAAGPQTLVIYCTNLKRKSKAHYMVFCGGNRFHLLWHYYFKPPTLYWVPTMFQALCDSFPAWPQLLLTTTQSTGFYYPYSPNEEAEVCGDEAKLAQIYPELGNARAKNYLRYFLHACLMHFSAKMFFLKGIWSIVT